MPTVNNIALFSSLMALLAVLEAHGFFVGIRRVRSYFPRTLSREPHRALSQAHRLRMPDRAEGLPVERGRGSRRDAKQGRRGL